MVPHVPPIIPLTWNIHQLSSVLRDDCRDFIRGHNLQQIKALLSVLRVPVSGNKDVLVQRALANIFRVDSEDEDKGSSAEEELNQQASMGNYLVIDDHRPPAVSREDDAGEEQDSEQEESEGVDEEDEEDEEDEIIWNKSLDASKIEHLGKPKRRTATIHAHLLHDQLFMSCVKKARERIQKAMNFAGSQEGLILIEARPHVTEREMHLAPSQGKSADTMTATTRSAYHLLIPLFIIAVYFYSETALDPYAPLFTWTNVGWFLTVYMNMPKKGNSRGRDIEGASSSMLARLQMALNGSKAEVEKERESV
jgi:hypothetical protein